MRTRPWLTEPPVSLFEGSRLSVRAENCLRNAGIDTLYDLSKLTVEDLLNIPNCGRKTADEIAETARQLGVELGAGTTPTKQAPPVPTKVRAEFLLRLTDFPLSVRAENCLKAEGIEFVGDLATRTQNELYRLQNCGRRTVIELQTLLLSLDLRSGMHVPDWRKTDPETLRKEHRYAAVLKLRGQGRFQQEDPDSSRGIETEISSALSIAIRSSHRPKVEAWLSLNEGRPPTLEKVGQNVGLTRERVRQVVQAAEKRIRKFGFSMPKLRQALQCLENNSIIPVDNAARAIQNKGYTDGSVSISALLRATQFLGVQTTLTCRPFGGVSCVGTPESFRVAGAIVRLGRRSVEHWGCATIEDIRAQATEHLGVEVKTDSARNLLSSQNDFHWLDQESGWFWLSAVPRNRLLNRIDKVLAVAHRIDLAEMRIGVARQNRMEGFAPPSRALRSLCEQLEDCDVVDDHLLQDTRPRHLSEELSKQEQFVVNVFQEHGPVLSYREALARCLAVGMNENTAKLTLMNSVILRRVSPGVYTLIGVQLSPGQVRAVAGRGKARRVVQDCGWTPDGEAVWVTYRVSAGLLRSGVASLPSGIRSFVSRGRYELRGKDGPSVGHIGIGDGSLWGLLSLFARL